MDLPELLSSFSAKLVSEQRYEAFVRSLFRSPAGVWRRVGELCAGLPGLERHESLLRENHDSFVVTYLAHPEDASGGYAVILFVHLERMWSTPAIYNRRRLDEETP